MRKVFIVQDKKTLIVFGCFENKIKAINYIDGNFERFAVIESDVL